MIRGNDGFRNSPQDSLKMMVLLSESSDFGVPFGWILKSFEWGNLRLRNQRRCRKNLMNERREVTVKLLLNIMRTNRSCNVYLELLSIFNLFTLSMASRLVTDGPAFVFNTLFEQFLISILRLTLGSSSFSSPSQMVVVLHIPAASLRRAAGGPIFHSEYRKRVQIEPFSGSEGESDKNDGFSKKGALEIRGNDGSRK